MMEPAGGEPQGSSQFVAINPEAFAEGYSTDVLLAYLARDVLKARLGSRAQLEGGTAPLQAKSSLEKVQRLVGTLDRAEAELRLLHKEVTKKVSRLQAAVNEQEASHLDGLGEVEAIGERIRGAFRDLESRCAKVSQIGARIGDRLQTADALRTKATELAQLLHHLQAFSQLPEPGPGGAPGTGSQYKQLAPLFTDDKQLAQAAAVARKLTRLTSEAHNAKQRSRLVGADEGDGPGPHGIKGTLTYTTWQLAMYCNWLEGRVLARFDKGMAKGSTRIMGECAAIMALFDAEKLLVQRYVSAQAVFSTDPEELGAPEVWPPAGDTPADMRRALAPFSRLCDMLLATVQEEAPRMAATFTDKRAALQLLVQRIAEERIRPALEALLQPGAAPLPDLGSDKGSEESEGDDDEEEEEPDQISTMRQGRKEAAGAAILHGRATASSRAAGARQQPRGRAVAAGDGNDDEGDEEEEDEEEGSDEGGSGSGSEGTGAADHPTPWTRMEREIAAAFGRGSEAGSHHEEGPEEPIGWGMVEPLQTLHMRLTLLAETYSRSLGLAEGMEQACTAAGVPSTDLSLLKETLFAEFLANYPYPELRWLDLCYQEQLAVLGADMSGMPSPINPSLAATLIANNKESLGRVSVLSFAGGSEAVVAAHTRLLFHGAGPFQECPGCLLEQLAKHIINGVEASLTLCNIRDPRTQAQQEVAAYHAEQEAKAAAYAAALELYEKSKGKKNAPPLPLPPAPPPLVTRSSAAQRAQAFVDAKVSKVVESVSGAATIMAALQEHYLEQVVPRVSFHLGELSLCSSGLLLLLKAVEESCSVVLQRLVDAVIIQAEKTLMIEQRREDFYPERSTTASTPGVGLHGATSVPAMQGAGDKASGALDSRGASSANLDIVAGKGGSGGKGADGMVRTGSGTAMRAVSGAQLGGRGSVGSGLADLGSLLGQPTPACLLVCALLDAVRRAAAEQLGDANLTAFLKEVGSRAHALLLNHMQQFRFSVAGALRWKGDVGAYCDIINAWGVPGLRQQMDSLQALVNVLVVPPEGLMGLVNGSLRLDHREALKFIRLREDYMTAAVEGRTLQELFSAGANSVDAIVQAAAAGVAGTSSGR